MSDFRIKTEFFNHPKTQRLLRLLGADGVLSLLRLWSFAATTFPDGVLRGMDAPDIETAAGWNGKPGALYEALISDRTCFIDPPDGECKDPRLHNWQIRQPWLFHSKARSEQAKHAIASRWAKRGVRTPDTGTDAGGIRSVYAENTERNTPLPLPSPIPKISLSEVTSDARPECLLTKKLIDGIKGNNPKAKIPANLTKWVNEARLMLERDNRPYADIQAIIEFSQRDDFWKSNILSMPKLREKFDQLYLKMKSPKNGAVLSLPVNESKRESAAAIAERMRAAQ